MSLHDRIAARLAKQAAMLQAKLVRNPNTGCLIWTGTRNAHGYGLTGHGPAHRISYKLACGPIPYGKFVCHKCDVKLCCEPTHLYAGTAKDNARDTMDRHPTARILATSNVLRFARRKA